MPFFELSNEVAVQRLAHAAIGSIKEPVLESPRDCATNIAALQQTCLTINPSKRPTFAKLFIETSPQVRMDKLMVTVMPAFGLFSPHIGVASIVESAKQRQ